MVPPENALASLEVKHTGEHMPQHTEESGPVFAQNHPDRRPMPHSGAQEPGPHQHRRHGLHHVQQNDHQGQRSAEGAVEIGEACVSAAVGAHVVAQDILGDDDGPVKAAAEIGDYRRQGREPNHGPNHPAESLGLLQPVEAVV